MRILAVLLLVALALMHWVLPGQIEGSMNLVRAHAPYERREDARTRLSAASDMSPRPADRRQMHRPALPRTTSDSTP